MQLGFFSAGFASLRSVCVVKGGSEVLVPFRMCSFDEFARGEGVVGVLFEDSNQPILHVFTEELTNHLSRLM